MTIGRWMALVAIVALYSAILLAIPPGIDPLIRERSLRLGTVAYPALVILLACLVTTPWVGAFALAFDVARETRRTGRVPLRRSVAALALFAIGARFVFGPLPLDGLRQAGRADRDTFVAFYHQYRLWPGRNINPCLEIMSSDGKARSYPIGLARTVDSVEFRTNADRSRIWVVERNPNPFRPPPWPLGVLCSYDLPAREFVGVAGPFPPDVSGEGGFPLSR